ncbi:MAG TPA: class I SAM-dependent methyltransferase [Gemmata sp.]|jgi:SAM-dependent methyltransferase|nr:class I SAM-dependent methyltransferase [Gemmata sp.]
MGTFNPAQYEDFLAKSEDVYARTKYEIILGWLRGRGPLRILNAGCGSGELSLLMAREGHRVIGIDPEPAYIRLANQRAASHSQDCQFHLSSIENYSGPYEFDAVVSTDVLEHIENDRVAFNKLADLVRIGGKVILTLPAGQWLFGYHDEQLGHYRRYSASTLRRLVSERCRVHRLRFFGLTLIPICLTYSTWLRMSYPIAQVGSGKQSFVSRVLRGMLAIERHLHFPLGTSVLVSAERQATNIVSERTVRKAA